MKKSNNCLGLSVAMVFAFIALVLAYFNVFLAILVFLVGIVIMTLLGAASNRRIQAAENAVLAAKSKKREEAKQHLRPQYEAAYRDMGVPENCKTVSSKGYPDLYCWVAEGTLKFLTEWRHVEWIIDHNVMQDTDVESLTLFDFYCHTDQIPLDRIHHFQREGESYVETRVKGGGRATARIYPDSAAPSVIDLPEIETETIRHDERTTIIYYYEGDERQMSTHCFTYDAYNVFIALIPEKEYSRVVAEEIAAASGGSEEKGSLPERLEQLKALREADLITQEEYEEKKDELLKEL